MVGLQEKADQRHRQRRQHRQTQAVGLTGRHPRQLAAKASGLHRLGQLDGMLQAGGYQRHKEGQQRAPAAEAMPADSLGLANLAGAGQHLRHEGESNGGDHASLIEEGGRQTQQLGGVDAQVKGGEYQQQHPDGQPGDSTVSHSLQSDGTAHQRPVRR